MNAVRGCRVHLYIIRYKYMYARVCFAESFVIVWAACYANCQVVYLFSYRCQVHFRFIGRRNKVTGGRMRKSYATLYIYKHIVVNVHGPAAPTFFPINTCCWLGRFLINVDLLFEFQMIYTFTVLITFYNYNAMPAWRNLIYTSRNIASENCYEERCMQQYLLLWLLWQREADTLRLIW